MQYSKNPSPNLSSAVATTVVFLPPGSLVAHGGNPQDRTNSPQRAALLLKGEALKEKKNQTFVFYSSENRYIFNNNFRFSIMNQI